MPVGFKSSENINEKRDEPYRGYGDKPIFTNGHSHCYHLDKSTFIFRGITSDFQFFFDFSMKILLANRIAPNGMSCSATSHLGLYWLPMSQEKDARPI